MRIHILGLGPIGCLVAYHLRRTLPARHPITIIHKTQRMAVMARQAGNIITMETSGVTITANDFDQETADPHDEMLPVRNSKSTSTNPAFAPKSNVTTPIESLIVCVKAHKTLTAIRDLLPRISKDSTIVLVQNGMGVYEHLIQNLFRNQEQRPHFVLASVNHGAWLKEYLHVVHAGAGDLTFGIVPDYHGRQFEASLPDLNLDDITPNTHNDPSANHYLSLRNTIAALSSLSVLNTSWKSMYDTHMTMRRKVVVNAVINPLTALLNCRNGDVLAHKSGQNICRNVCQEASNAFQAQWKSELKDASNAGHDVGDAQFPEALSAASLVLECKRVAELTRFNYSSMLMDVRRARDTEILFLNGYLLGLGRKHNIYMPANNLLMNMMDLRSRIPLLS
ncbi:hypothetical protein PHLCEN_2v8259 [Hermanssonia centrifuga]|uniref:2-dehydropantoate 2-reductase n=1 Tax=Hermanssonia centrifuga TaxID=98765 RepID=A0A2R6NTZ9_9APHY|nr:hypothetical protein PHLCEN_2v8259 [Hermanssonia centrifuga]